ncbi:HEAT repeat domain-containing protein, partial [Planctomycetota bacterium]
REGAWALAAMLRDKNEDVRRRAVTCLGWLGEESWVPSVQSLLADRDPNVRRAALDALENLHATEATSEVMGLLHDQDERVRREAHRVLRVLAGVGTGAVPGDDDCEFPPFAQPSEGGVLRMAS